MLDDHDAQALAFIFSSIGAWHALNAVLPRIYSGPAIILALAVGVIAWVVVSEWKRARRRYHYSIGDSWRRRSVPLALVVVVLIAGLSVFAVSAVWGTGVDQVDDPVREAVEPKPEDGGKAVSTPPDTDTDRDKTGRLFEDSFTSSERRILDKVNEVRRERGLNTLVRSDRVQTHAENHSTNMIEEDFYGHNGPGVPPSEMRLMAIGSICPSTTAGENIHRGELHDVNLIYGSNESVLLSTSDAVAEYAVKSWMNSSGHRRNLLHMDWTHAGVGIESDGSDIYITMIYC